MSRLSLPSRFAFWLFACALLLKAAVPLLASASAGVQGKALVEVCTVYGVKTISLDGEPASDPQASHAADACALSAVMALGALQAAEGQALPFAGGLRYAAPAAAPAATAHDASARWRARLKQGPPAFS